MTDLCVCGHTREDHRHRRGNQHTTWTALDDCRADGCDCPGFGRWVDASDGDDVDETDDSAGEKVECTVCGALVGRGPAGLGTKQHAAKHRREFAEWVGRGPESYEEVRDVLGRPAFRTDHTDQLSLSEAVDDRAREARRDDGQADLSAEVLEDGGRE